MPIKKDPKYVAGEGVRDEVAEMLDAAVEASVETGGFKPGIEASANAIYVCRNLSWDAADRLHNLAQYIRANVTDAADEAARNAQGGAIGAEAARARVVRERSGELARQVSKEFVDEGVALGQRAQAEMGALKGQIDTARAALAYSEMDRKDDLTTLVALDRLGQQVRTRPVQTLFDTWMSMIQAGNDEKAEQLERASEPWLRELVSESPMKAKARATNGGTREARVDDALGKDRAIAWRLLQSFEAERSRRVPPELGLASKIYVELLVPSFQRVVGKSQWDLSDADYNSVFLHGQGKMPGQLELLQDWVTRNLPFARPGKVSDLTLARRGGDRGPHGWTLLSPRAVAGARARTPMNPSPAINRVDDDRSVVRP